MCPRGECTQIPMPARYRVRSWEPTVTADADQWMRWTTIVFVALPVLIAAIVSYLTPDYI